MTEKDRDLWEEQVAPQPHQDADTAAGSARDADSSGEQQEPSSDGEAAPAGSSPATEAVSAPEASASENGHVHYDPYAQPTETLHVLGQKRVRRAPYPFEASEVTKHLLSLTRTITEANPDVMEQMVDYTEQSQQGSGAASQAAVDETAPDAEQDASETDTAGADLAAEAFGAEADPEQVRENVRSFIENFLAVREMLQQIVENEDWTNLCQYVLSQFYDPPIEYHRLSPVVRDENGEVMARPIVEAHREVSEWLDWSDVESFLGGIDV